MSIRIRFDETGEKVTVSPLDLEFFDFGGQGQIYKWEYRGELYVVKVVPKDESVFRRLNQIKESVEGYAKRTSIAVPEGIARRGFPVGRGFVGNPKKLGFEAKDQLMVIVYRWVDGEPLDQYLRALKEPPLSSTRVKIAKQLLEILTVLEKAGVVNHDIFPDNFIVGPRGEIYVIDMEGAGLIDSSTGRWIWQPVALGKSIPGFCIPPEFYQFYLHSETRLYPEGTYLSSGNWDESIFSQRWIGAQLLFYIILGISPFAFMQRIDFEALYDLYMSSDKSKIAWPPIGSEKSRFTSKDKIEEFRSIIRSKCSSYGNVCPLEKLAFLTFIHGFERPSCRPSFEMMKLILKDILR